MTESQRLVDALSAAGWQQVGRGRGYVRLALVGTTHRHMLMVPLDESAPEFDHLMAAAVGLLERLHFDGRSALHALARFKPDVHYS